MMEQFRCYVFGYCELRWNANVISVDHCTPILYYTVSQKKQQDTKVLSTSSPNIDRFSTFFHCYTGQEICNKAIITDPTKH